MGTGAQLLSQRITNDEDTLLGLIAEVCSLASGGHVTWAIDLNSGGAALVLTLLADHDQNGPRKLAGSSDLVGVAR